MSGPKRRRLLHYWSIRYFVILIGSMTVLVVLMAYFIQLDVRREQHRGMQAMAEELAAAAEPDGGGLLRSDASLGSRLDELALRHGLSARTFLLIMDGDGRMALQYPPNPPQEATQLADMRERLLTGEPLIAKLEPYEGNPVYLVAVHPMEKAGSYVLLLKQEEALVRWSAYFNRRLILAAAIVLLGWGVIYVLMRRLIRPIREAGAAAKQIVAGDYDIQFERDYKEQEVHELMNNFKEMAARLGRLESMRTQLLAGVTHELKTPVASISGLVQAVRQGVVEGKEAEEFLDLSLKECLRLQKMVEDLLDFNAFAGQQFAVRREPCDLEATLREIVRKWTYAQDEAVAVKVDLDAALPGRQLREVMTDPDRLQQIMVNLLNNARDASEAGATVLVRLAGETDGYRIEVRDSGHGIAAAEQADIFEPFYRGGPRHKSRQRGLGIGLPHSRLMARSLGGDLLLADSSPAGTTFVLRLPLTP